MAIFNWEQDVITLDFGNLKIDLDVSEKILDDIQKSGNYLKANADEMKELNGEGVEILMNAIDMVVGDGGAARIFEGHTANVLNAMRVWTFICTEYAEKYKAHFEALRESSASIFQKAPNFSTPIENQVVRWHK